ncbi:MAG: glycosyltransferase [Pseudomonadota bacterium]
MIIAAWQADDTIDRSIAAALGQIGVRCQILVIDDASTDGLRERLSQRSDVRLAVLPANGGPAAARNRGLELAQGTWVAVLDADDTMRPDRLRNMIDEADRLNADALLGNFVRVDENGREIEATPFLQIGQFETQSPLTLEQYVSYNQVQPTKPSLGYLKPLIRRSFLIDHKLRYNESLRNGEDCHLIFSLLAAGARAFVSDNPDYLYTVRTGSISHRANPEHIFALIAADKEFVNQFSDQLSPETKHLFRTRSKSLLRLVHSEQIMSSLKNRKPAQALTLALQHPSAIRRVVRQLYESVGKRIGVRS